MAQFAKYYLDFLYKLLTNLWVFVSTRWGAIGDIFSNDIPGYFSDLAENAGEFGWVGWLCYILMTLVNCLLIFFIVYRLVQLVRRYILFRAKEVEKDELLEELARSKAKIAELTIEKNKIYAMKVSAMYPGYGAVAPEQEGEKNPDEISSVIAHAGRFNRLLTIDRKYENVPVTLSDAERSHVELYEIVDAFVNFAASQYKLYYTKDIARRFFAGMATSKVIILEGISGTGKTSLPYAMGRFFGGNSTIISVQPNWHDRADLMGYLNEFTKTYNETDFLTSLYEANYRRDPSIVILDEMNLARIEYYFADFLSIMEMPNTDEWLIDVVPTNQDSDPKNLVDGKLIVPQGLWFVGTANSDDSTFTITDKVYDRTVTIDINAKGEKFDAPVTPAMDIPSDYLDIMFRQAQTDKPLSDRALEQLKDIDEFMIKRFKLTYGNRILKQIKNFVPVYVACGGTEAAGLDFMLQSKILRKLQSLNLSYLTKELGEFITFIDKTFGKNKCPLSIEFLKELKRTM